MRCRAEQLEELKATAVKQWEPRGDYRIKLLKEDTPTLLTQEAAEKASTAMRTYNRLLAYVDEFGLWWEADWADKSQVKRFIFYAYKDRLWDMGCHNTTRVSGAVYMSKDCAEGLVAKLNTGEVIL